MQGSNGKHLERSHAVHCNPIHHPSQSVTKPEKREKEKKKEKDILEIDVKIVLSLIWFGLG